MREVHVVISRYGSQWGPSVARFKVSDTTYDHEVHEALEYAKCELEETGIPEEWGTGELNDAILNIAAEALGATWEYVGIVEFKYEYDGLYLEEIAEMEDRE